MVDSFSKEPLTGDQLRSSQQRIKGVPNLRDTVPREVIERIMKEKIAWKLSHSSSYETKLNAFKVSTKIGRIFVGARKGPHEEAFEDGVLEKTLTDTMWKICGFTDGGSAGLSFLDDKEFMPDIFSSTLRGRVS